MSIGWAATCGLITPSNFNCSDAWVGSLVVKVTTERLWPCSKRVSTEAAMVETSPGARMVLLGLAGVHPHDVLTFLISSGPLPLFLIIKTCWIGGPLSAVPKL